MIEELRQWLRCRRGDHEPTEKTYTSLATGVGLFRHPECCKGGFIRMRKVTCEACGDCLEWHPIEYAHD